MALKSIKTLTIQETVYKQLYQEIIEGKIPPGEKVTLKSLAGELGVSVMPVREAIRKLEARGFLTIESNKQIKVKVLSPDHFKQILNARLMLEGHVIKVASKIRSEESIIKMEQSLKRMDEAGSYSEYIQENKRFHFLIYRESKLTVFLEIIESLWAKVSPYFYALEKNLNRDFSPNHMGMVKAMKNKNPVAANKWLRKDLTEAATILFTTLKEEE